MATRPPHGNLTAALVVVAALEMVVNRLLGHLFATPTCQSVASCLALRAGPFLLYLTGVLALIVLGGGIVGHLLRGELFPRGMRITIGALSMVFLILLAASLLAGQAPARYETHLQTSFGVVTAMVALAFLTSTSTARGPRPRARIGLTLFVLPPLLHVASFVASRAGWWRGWWLSADALSLAGETALLLAAVSSPALLLPVPRAWSRLAPALALAAGVGTFFFVASVGRPDLIQAIGLYSVHLELPRGSSLLGVAYTAALVGYTVTLVSLLLTPGPARLSGLGLALLGLGGYQTASPVELALTLAGIVTLATGLSRMEPAARAPALSADGWRSLMESIAARVSSTPVGVGAGVVEISGGEEPGSDTATVRATRGGRPVELVVRRNQGVVETLAVLVGVRPDGAPDATIEAHETWLSRPPAERPSAPRHKTGDLAFDRKWGVYGKATLADSALRRRWLRHMSGTVRLWSGSAAENLVTTARADGASSGFAPAATALLAVADVVDALGTLLETEEPAPTPAPPQPVTPTA